MTGSTGRGAGRPAHRRLAVLVLAALAGAGCCAGAAAITWWSRDYSDSLAGTVHTVARGSDLLGELVPVALVALAGLGAAFATRGPLRRVVGVLVALAGLLVAVRAGLAVGTAPVQVLAGQLKRPATPADSAHLTIAGPLLAIVGGVLVILAGVLVATGADRARRMGSAYDAPARRREQALRQAAARSAGPTGAGEPADPGDLWRAMDAGADPTADPASDPIADPASDPTADPASDPTADPATDPPADLAGRPPDDPVDGAPDDSFGAPGTAPGQGGASGAVTMGAPDGPAVATPGRSDHIDRSGRRDEPARSRQAPNEETTG